MFNKVSQSVSQLPYGITQCYLAPDTSELAPPKASQTGRYSINLPGGMEG